MGLIRISRPWTRQPQGVVGINRNNPLGRNLNMLLMTVGGRVIDLVNPNEVWTPGGDAKSKVTSAGIAASFDGTGDYFTCTGYARYSGNGTIFAWFPTIRGLVGSGQMLLCTSAIYTYIANDSVFHFTGLVNNVNTGAIFNSTNTSIVLTNFGVGSGIYTNGVLDKSGGSPGAFPAGAKTLRYGDYTGGGFGLNADCVILGWTNDTWTAKEAKAFHDNPWQLFAPLPARIWAPSGGVAPTFRPWYAPQRSRGIGIGMR